jgi:N-acyl-phosphatidylethanolamine-hydrolysing phospholipase D
MTIKKVGGKFINPHAQGKAIDFRMAVAWWLGRFREPVSSPPENFAYPALVPPFDRSQPYAFWIGHSTCLIHTGEATFLTDPLWETFCSPFPMPGLRRIGSVPLPLEALPRLDAVLVSHNHYDHLGKETVCALKRLQPQAQWIVPAGLKRWFIRRGIQPFAELHWGESCQIGAHQIHAVPSQHFSRRRLWDRDRSLWCGYVVAHRERKFYFVGDTGYNPVDFQAIGDRFAPIDLSLIPIGTYVPSAIMSTVHVNPREAVKIHAEVGSRFSVGIHWQTFRLSEEPLDRPPYDLFLAMQEQKIPFEQFLPIPIGTYINW